MKKTMIFSVLPLAVLTVACSVLFLGCNDLHRLDAPQFLKQAEQIKVMHSAKNIELIGVTRNRVYLEYWRAPLIFDPGPTIYWTPLDDLPKAIASELKAGKNPWKPEQ